MSPVDSTIDPLLTDGEREELRHLDYLNARIKELLDRGLITSDACTAILDDGRLRRDVIERQGRYKRAIHHAHGLTRVKPGEALTWAERARKLDPSQSEPWLLGVDLLWNLERDDEAIELCARAVEHFPNLRQRHETLCAQVPERADARRRKAERERRELELSRRMAAARDALKERRDDRAVEICREILAEEPHRVDVLSMAAAALQRLGRVDEALELYSSLSRLQPGNAAWSERVRSLEYRLRARGPVAKSPEPEEVVFIEIDPDSTPGVEKTPPLPPPAPAPSWSWSSIAAEFLEEHWQKLILCLAVLLIVVSSTVGAHVLLGPLLWLPAGTCAMALVWTIAFAALGWGLIQWGAERAGRMMLVATLMVVPIHFMLAGELKLVTVPTVSGVIAAVVDGIALIGLVRVVAGMLVSRGQARFLATALLLMSVGSVATARGSPVPWGWQFAAFQTPAVVFLAAAWVLGLRRWGESDESHRQFTILALGLLGLAFLACTARIGAYALRIHPALYAVPVMVGAIAAVLVSRRLGPSGTDGRQPAWIRFGGYVLSGLAFALAMTPPPVPSALFSADAVVAGLLGFGLYASALRRERHPAFLYLSLGALVAARVDAQYFLADRIRLVIDQLRHLLGYSGPLPIAFLALLGLVVNPALALLSIWFRKAWKDERLALHCHYIGLPVAVAACLWSCQEPKTAAVVLSGYAVLFGLAVWLFAVPVLSYAAIGALCGACYFGSTLIAGVTPADQALIAVGLAWICLCAGQLLRRLDADEGYAVPWTNAARALTPLAFLVATVYIAVRGPHSPAAAAVFPMAGILAFLGARERPRVPHAAMVLLCFVEFTICGLSLLTGGRPLAPSTYGVLLACDGLALLAVTGLLEWAKTLGRALGEATENEGSTRLRLGVVFAVTLPRFVIGLTMIADLLALADLGRTWVPGLVWLLGAPALLGTTRRLRRVSLVYLGIAQFVAGGLALSDWSMGFGQDGLRIGWMAVSTGVLALGLWLVGLLTRRRGVSDFYVAPCFHWCLGLTLVVLSLSISSRFLARDAYRFGVLALALNASATILLSVTWRRTELTYPAVLHLVIATYLVLFSVGNNDPRMAYVLGLAGVIQAIVWWAAGFACERVAGGRARSYAPPLYHLAVALTMLGIVLSDRSAIVLAMAAVAFLLTVKSLPRVEWIYAAVACAGASVSFRWLAGMAPVGLLVSVMAGAFGLWAIGVLVQRNREWLCDRLGLRPLTYEFPFFHSSMAVGLIAVALRVFLSVNQGVAWNAYAWLPVLLSLLVLLMPRAYPLAEWMHLSLAFLVYGFVSAISPTLVSISAIALAGMSMGLVLRLLEHAIRTHERSICERLGVGDAGYLGVVRAWTAGLFTLASILVLAVVVSGMATAYGLRQVPGFGSRSLDWWMTMATLGLSAGYVVVAARDPRDWIAIQPTGVLCGLHAIGLLGLWWLGARSSPLFRILPPAVDYYPIATAIAALGAMQLGRRYAGAESEHELRWSGNLRTEGTRLALVWQAGSLTLLAIALAIGGIIVSDHQAVTLAVAASVFLLAVKSLPLTEWLYGTTACLGASVYLRWLSGMAPGRQMASVLACAFGLWAIGVLVQRFRQRICDRLGLRPMAYELPFFHSSMAVGLIAVILRVSLSVDRGVAWNAYAWLPVSMSLLVLLMARAYPWAEWVHLSLAFLVYGFVSALSPALVSFSAIGLAGMSMALGLCVLEHAIRSHEREICDRLGIGDAGYLGVVRFWSTGLFGVSSALVFAVVIWGMAAAFGIPGVQAPGSRAVDWWMALATLGLAAVYLVLAGSDPRGWIAKDLVVLPSGLHLIVVLGLWWLGVGHSPLHRLLPPAVDYYPIATAIAALTAIQLARRFAVPEDGSEPGWVGEGRPTVARQALAMQAGLLAILAIVFTGGIISGTTVATVFLASMAIAMAALMSGWEPAAGLASVTWAGAWSILGAWLARRLGLMAADQQAILAASGTLISAFVLWVVAGILRGGWTVKSAILPEESPDADLGLRFARVLEGVASAMGLLASAAVLAMGLREGVSQPWVALAGLGVLLASAILHVALAPRWRSEVPVYVAQTLMVGAYVEFRLAFSMSSAVDASVLTLLAYLDMGMAEMLERLDRGGYYTRPTRYTSLVLPILPLLPLFRTGIRDEIALFYLAAAAAFYATACGRLRWKSLGYAAAVFANSALWLLWSLIGCRLAEYPQLYLVPVGLSAILFAEVNRELGRAAVNAIRSVGLTVIYVALAMPIWQFASFTAWLILLLASLLGVFIGIGLRLQTFLWLGLATFVLDVVYEMGRMTVDHAMAKWAIMLGLGIALVLFVALNEKKRILSQMLDYYADVRSWE